MLRLAFAALVGACLAQNGMWPPATCKNCRAVSYGLPCTKISICNCSQLVAQEDDVGELVACFDTDKRYVPLDMPGQGMTTEPSAWRCQSRCRSVNGCEHFSWWPDGRCHLHNWNATLLDEALMEGLEPIMTGPPRCLTENSLRGLTAGRRSNVYCGREEENPLLGRSSPRPPGQTEDGCAWTQLCSYGLLMAQADMVACEELCDAEAEPPSAGPGRTQDNADYVLGYYVDSACKIPAGSPAGPDAEYWWWTDLTGGTAGCGKLLGVSGGGAAWHGPLQIEEDQLVHPLMNNTQRFVGVPYFLHGGPYFSPATLPSGQPWDLTLTFESPITLYLFEEEGEHSVLSDEALEEDQWHLHGALDFAQSPALHLNRVQFRVWSRDFYTNSSYTLAVNGTFHGAVASAFECVQTTTTTTTITTTTTTTRTTTVTERWEILMGPHRKYGFDWFLGGPGVSCDGLCIGMGGQNHNPTAAQVADDGRIDWPDRCLALVGHPDDVAIWFRDHGNKCNWTGDRPDTTEYRSMGYGYRDGRYYQKCAGGDKYGSGSWPGELISGSPDRCMVCACNLAGRRLDGEPAGDAPPGREGAAEPSREGPTEPLWSEATVVDAGPWEASPEEQPASDAGPAQGGHIRGSRKLADDEESAILDGPMEMHGYEWYLSAPGATCDAVCSEVGGLNMNANASMAWSDYCMSGASRVEDVGWDVATWFFTNGNAGGWTETWRYVSGPTNYFTLGFGYPGGAYWQKCTSGSDTGSGALPGDLNNDPTRTNICACNLGVPYTFGYENTNLCPRGYIPIEDEAVARTASDWYGKPPGVDFLKWRVDRPLGMYAVGNASLFSAYFNQITTANTNPKGYPICQRHVASPTSSLEVNSCYTGLTRKTGSEDRVASLLLQCSEEYGTLRWSDYNLGGCMGPSSQSTLQLVDTGQRFLDGGCLRRGEKYVKLNRRISRTHLRYMECPVYHTPHADPTYADFLVDQSCAIAGSSRRRRGSDMRPQAFWWVTETGCITSQEFHQGVAVSTATYYTFSCDCPHVSMIQWDSINCTGSARVALTEEWTTFQAFIGGNCYGSGDRDGLGMALDKSMVPTAFQALQNCPMPGTLAEPSVCMVVETTTTTTNTGTEELQNTTTLTRTTTPLWMHFVTTTTRTTSSSSPTPEPIFPVGGEGEGWGTPPPREGTGGSGAGVANPNMIGVTSSASAPMPACRHHCWLVALLVSAAVREWT